MGSKYTIERGEYIMMGLGMKMREEINKIAHNNDVSGKWCKDQAKLMKEYRSQGSQFGDTVSGYKKWLSQKSVK